jgi:AcrR family transcriptional regulator
MSLGRPPRSTRAEVVDVGLELLKSEGLAAVTLAAIGDRLGLHKVALYTYVKNKEDLLFAMRDEVYRRQLKALRDEESLAPEVALKAMCTHLQGLMADYGQLMVAIEPDLAGPGLDVSERFLDLLARAGLSPRQQVQVFVLLTILLASTVSPRLTAGAGVGDPAVDVDPLRYPRLVTLLHEGLPSGNVPVTDLTEDALLLILEVLIPALRAQNRQ